MDTPTTFAIVCGQLRTRTLHSRYSEPPTSPATTFRGCSSGKKLINVYMHKNDAVPAHCIMLLSFIDAFLINPIAQVSESLFQTVYLAFGFFQGFFNEVFSSTVRKYFSSIFVQATA